MALPLQVVLLEHVGLPLQVVLLEQVGLPQQVAQLEQVGLVPNFWWSGFGGWLDQSLAVG